MSPYVNATDVLIKGGIAYWIETASNDVVPQAWGSVLRCIPVHGGNAKTISSGPGTSLGLVVSSRVYFQVCDSDCTSGGVTLRSAALCE
jgi:hypothetical protein